MTTRWHPDSPHPSGDDRFAVYTIRNGEQVRLAETSREGLGITITTLVAEGEFRDGADAQRPLGIFDREERRWIINPHASGSRS